MPSDHAPPTYSFLPGRTRAVSVWLARSRVTASCEMKAMMGKNRVTIHSATGGGLLFSLDWSGLLVVVASGELESPYRFHDLKSAITFFDAVLLSHVSGPSDSQSTGLEPLAFGTP